MDSICLFCFCVFTDRQQGSVSRADDLEEHH